MGVYTLRTQEDSCNGLVEREAHQDCGKLKHSWKLQLYTNKTIDLSFVIEVQRTRKACPNNKRMLLDARYHNLIATLFVIIEQRDIETTLCCAAERV